MSIALDLGVHRMRSLRVHGDRLLARSCRTLHAVLPDSEPQRRTLERLHVPFATSEGGLVIVGDAAAEFAPLFQAPALPLFPDGDLPHDDPAARQVLAFLVDGLLWEPRRRGEICGLVVPGPMRDAEFPAQLVRLRGYTPVVVSAGLAVVLAALHDAAFTGIGLSMGGGSCEISLAHRGVELARCGLPRGGHWIDEQARSALEGTATWNESQADSLVRPSSEGGRVLGRLYRELLDELLAAAAREFARHPVAARLPQPMPLAVCGGPARAPGFVLLLEEALRQASLPVEVGSVRGLACEYTVARGCLINAELETDARPAAAAAA